MQTIGKNSEVLNYLSGNLSLLDATISKFEISLVEDSLVGDSLNISIYFQLMKRTKTDIKVLLIFKEVIEYSFYHNSKYSFYYVEELKFFETEGKFYFSGDPYHTEGVSENDNDFIMSRELEGYIL